MNITVLYSLPTRRALATPYKATDEDTEDSALEVKSALKEKGATINLLGIDEDSIDKIRTIHADIIFNLIEWDGLDTPLSLAAFDAIISTSIPFTGGAKEAIVVCNDKAKMKSAFDIAGIATPRWQLFTKGDEGIRSDFTYPVILKLSREHCSVGLTKDAVVMNYLHLPNAILERINIFHQPVYVEEFISGRELQVTLLSTKEGLRVLPPAEIVFKNTGKTEFLTYDSRWNEDHPEYAQSTVAKAKLSPSLMQKLYRVAHKTFTSFNFRDYARLDIRLGGDDIYILEANANPGLGDDDDYGMTVSYKAAGMNFADFCGEIVASCLRRSYSRKK